MQHTSELVLLIAHIRPARSAKVAIALREIGITGWSESRETGHGQAASGHGVEHVRLEIALERSAVDACTQAIVTAAQTGADGDGVIWSVPIETMHRISNVAQGIDALRTSP